MHYLRLLRNYLPHWLVNYFFHLPLAFIAVIFYGYPSRRLKVIGITGTDGKTTTSTLIYEILKKSGKKVALISSVSAKIGTQNINTGFHVTTPNAWQLQKLLREIVKKKFNYLVLEATSHGLSQFRLAGCNFHTGVITNVTHEHLDYHQTWKDYLMAKAKLFSHTKNNILNKDDKSYYFLRSKIRGRIITYGLKDADFTKKNFPFETQLPGRFNQYNCLAAIATAKSLGFADSKIREVIANFKGITGRMEIILEKPFKVLIDFAHTPNALKNVLSALKSMPHRRLIAVFGAAGLRDSSKRPLMGKIAGRLADKIILTAEDPRTEDVSKIIDEIAEGCESKKKIIKEPDREKAIELALKLALRGDIVGIFGKGHEQSMCFGQEEFPWSDKEAVKKILNLKKVK